jgi:hypothetical protein
MNERVLRLLTYSCSSKCRLMCSHEAFRARERERSNKSRHDLCSTNIDLLMTRQISIRMMKTFASGKRESFSIIVDIYVYLREGKADETVRREKIDKF